LRAPSRALVHPRARAAVRDGIAVVCIASGASSTRPTSRCRAAPRGRGRGDDSALAIS